MRKTKVKKLRKEFEKTIEYLDKKDRLRPSSIYKSKWRKFKKNSN